MHVPSDRMPCRLFRVQGLGLGGEEEEDEEDLFVFNDREKTECRSACLFIL